jgi:hypothetical protein
LQVSTYHRLNVYDYIDRFCGYDAIDELLKYCTPSIYQNFFLTMFKTGGRVSEALPLMANNFFIDKEQGCLVVSDMPLEKRYIRNKVTNETLKINAVRKPFPILLGERLTPELLELVQSKHDLLFPSPYKGNNKPLSRVRVYQKIREVSDSLPPKLFRELGLDRPFKDKLGNILADKIHLWNHWFRSQRASSLKASYGFTEGDLMEWFQWLDFKTATHYAHLGYSGLANKMKGQGIGKI